MYIQLIRPTVILLKHLASWNLIVYVLYFPVPHFPDLHFMFLQILPSEFDPAFSAPPFSSFPLTVMLIGHLAYKIPQSSHFATCPNKEQLQK